MRFFCASLFFLNYFSGTARAFRPFRRHGQSVAQMSTCFTGSRPIGRRTVPATAPTGKANLLARRARTAPRRSAHERTKNRRSADCTDTQPHGHVLSELHSDHTDLTIAFYSSGFCHHSFFFEWFSAPMCLVFVLKSRFNISSAARSCLSKKNFQNPAVR